MVDPTLQHEHEAMQQAAGEFSRALEDLNSYVAPVRADHDAMQWQSDAATKYRELFDQWLIQFGDICKALETMREVLGASAKDYADNEAWAVQTVRTLSGGGDDYTAAQKAMLGM